MSVMSDMLAGRGDAAALEGTLTSILSEKTDMTDFRDYRHPTSVSKGVVLLR
jgi:hypothetical protein